MRSLEPDFETAVNAYNQLLVSMVEFEFSSTYRYTSADINMVYSGNTYYSRGLEISPSQFQLDMSIDKASVQLDNTDRSIGAIIEANVIWNKVARIRVAALTDVGAVSGQEVIFTGVVDSAEYNEQRAKFNIYNILIFWKRKVPRRQYSPSCQVPNFKDAYCGYSGTETWCDRSWERCLALDNHNNHRGFRWIAELEGKQIYWGRVPKT